MVKLTIVSKLSRLRFSDKVDKIVRYINEQYLEFPATIVTITLQKSKNKIKCFNIKVNPEFEKRNNIVHETVH